MSNSLVVILPPGTIFFVVRPIFYKIWILMIYSQLVPFNEGSTEVLNIFVKDFYLLNLSKTLGEHGQKIWTYFFFLAKFTKSSTSKSHKQRSWGPMLTLNRYSQFDCTMWHTYILWNICLTVKTVSFLGVIHCPGWILPYVREPSSQYYRDVEKPIPDLTPDSQ